MRKAYKKARFRRVWFRRLDMSMKWSFVPIEMFDLIADIPSSFEDKAEPDNK